MFHTLLLLLPRFWSFPKTRTRLGSWAATWLVQNHQSPPLVPPLTWIHGSDWWNVGSVTVTMDFGFAGIQVRTWFLGEVVSSSLRAEHTERRHFVRVSDTLTVQLASYFVAALLENLHWRIYEAMAQRKNSRTQSKKGQQVTLSLLDSRSPGRASVSSPHISISYSANWGSFPFRQSPAGQNRRCLSLSSFKMLFFTAANIATQYAAQTTVFGVGLPVVPTVFLWHEVRPAGCLGAALTRS